MKKLQHHNSKIVLAVLHEETPEQKAAREAAEKSAAAKAAEESAIINAGGENPKTPDEEKLEHKTPFKTFATEEDFNKALIENSAKLQSKNSKLESDLKISTTSIAELKAAHAAEILKLQEQIDIAKKGVKIKYMDLSKKVIEKKKLPKNGQAL